jgi:hypothetical protein
MTPDVDVMQNYDDFRDAFWTQCRLDMEHTLFESALKCARHGVICIAMFQLCGDAEGKNIGSPGICTILCNGQYGTYKGISTLIFLGF